MTGLEHYREAERLARICSRDSDATAARLAQVHATLALAAATALDGKANGPTQRAWLNACAEEGPPLGSAV